MKPSDRQFAKPLPNHSMVRTPPQSLEAEQALLGAVMLEKKMLLEVRHILEEEDFFREAHRKLYRAILNLDDRSAKIDILTVSEELKRQGEFEEIGGVSALTTLIEKCPTPSHAEYYAQEVAEKAAKRRFITSCNRALERAYEDNEEDSNKLSEKLMGELVTGQKSKKGFLDPSELSRRIADEVMTGERMEYIPTGFDQLDAKLGGIRIGHIGVVTGPAEQGKSTFVANLAVNVARAKKKTGGKFKVTHFILEDDAVNVMNRQTCLLNGITMDRLKSTDPLVMESGKKLTAYHKWSELNIWLGDKLSVGCVWEQVKLQILRQIRRVGVDLLLIEGGELLEVRIRQGENKADAEARMVNELDTIAQENQIAIWVILGMGKNDEGYKGVGSNAWWKIQRQSLKIRQDKNFSSLSYVEIGKTNDRKKWKEPFKFETVGDTFKWVEIETAQEGVAS